MTSRSSTMWTIIIYLLIYPCYGARSKRIRPSIIWNTANLKMDDLYERTCSFVTEKGVVTKFDEETKTWDEVKSIRILFGTTENVDRSYSANKSDLVKHEEMSPLLYMILPEDCPLFDKISPISIALSNFEYVMTIATCVGRLEEKGKWNFADGFVDLYHKYLTEGTKLIVNKKFTEKDHGGSIIVHTGSNTPHVVGIITGTTTSDEYENIVYMTPSKIDDDWFSNAVGFSENTETVVHDPVETSPSPSAEKKDQQIVSAPKRTPSKLRKASKYISSLLC